MSYAPTKSYACAPGQQKSFLQKIFAMNALHRQRKQLANLPTSALADIGLTTQDVAVEQRKSLWDAPVYFRK
ncbi:hypothetical protein GCM10008927_29860 [Amylibacter ulvae]|uniref:YjiS-like domain-containing protein n=1 Tax=Paramylibacter ulvae TaxID=1651968 RepID=A0ABQ3D7W3_9RHOB|nr:DUF1127 domain-containing protein [Amylibacter ulvae]GHA62489.1 hypothetical protein GCM10008927_29860 [Amylibacter ulvae]